MSAPEEHEMPDVSTESQRQALDEMSRQLVERLNDMVQEQHERARRFAAMQHSLSPLPELPPMEAAPEAAPPLPAPAPRPATPERRKTLPLPPRPSPPKEPQNVEAAPLRDVILHNKRPASTPAAPAKKQEEAGCGSGTLITFIVIIILIVRSCT